jgi:putative transposase
MTLLTRSRLRAGEVIVVNGLRHTLLRLFGTETWQVEVQTTREIKTYEQSDLLRLYVAGLLVFAEDWRDPRLDATRKSFTWSEVEKNLTEPAKRRLSYIKSAQPFPKAARAIQEVVLATARRIHDSEPPHPVTVLEWRRVYERSGEDPMALLPQHGAKGRRSSAVQHETYFAIEQAVEAVYLQRNQNSLKHTVDIAQALVKEKNKQTLENGGNEDKLIAVPTTYQVRRRIDEIPAYDRAQRRKGRDEAERLFRSTAGHYSVRGPLYLVEMDPTPVDVFIIDEKTFIPMGRPIVTLGKDVFSRAIPGSYITFDKPSFRSTAQCLRHCLLPKEPLNHPEIEVVNPWFAYGVMHQLSVDNGMEFHSDEFDSMCFANSIDPIYAKRKTGWHKPHIERFIGTMNRQFVHTLPGTTFSNIFEKGDYNPKKDAVLTFDVFKALLEKWICDVYSVTCSTSTGLTPMSAWEKNITPQDIPLLAAPLNMTPFIGYREPSRVASENGIQQNRLQYNSPALRQLRDRYGDKVKVEIRWDSADLGSIWVMHPNEPEPIEVPALDLDYAKGLSLYQHRRIQEYVRAVMRAEDSNSVRLQAKLDIARSVQAAMQQAGRGGTYKSNGLAVKVDVGRYTHPADGARSADINSAAKAAKLAPLSISQLPAERTTAPQLSDAAAPTLSANLPVQEGAARKPKKFGVIYDGQTLTENSDEAIS